MRKYVVVSYDCENGMVYCGTFHSHKRAYECIIDEMKAYGVKEDEIPDLEKDYPFKPSYKEFGETTCYPDEAHCLDRHDDYVDWIIIEV